MTPSHSTIRAYLSALYGADAPGFLSIFAKPSNTVTVEWCAAAELDAAATAVSRLAKAADVYVGLATRREVLGNGRRGGRRDVLALPALRADIDLRRPGSRPYPPTEADAITLLDSLPCPPTAIVWTGHGLNPLWVFRSRGRSKRTLNAPRQNGCCAVGNPMCSIVAGRTAGRST